MMSEHLVGVVGKVLRCGGVRVASLGQMWDSRWRLLVYRGSSSCLRILARGVATFGRDWSKLA